MPHTVYKARGIATAALVLLICVSCTPPEPSPPHEPRSLEATIASLRRGNLDQFRVQLGKGGGFAAHANELREKLDEPAWLIAVGAVEREYRMNLAVPALQSGDSITLVDALGFSEQALRADILNGGASVEFQKSNGRKYFSVAPQPIDIADGVTLPGLPVGALALHVALYGKIEDRHYLLRYSIGPNGVTNLQATRELAIRSLLPDEDVGGHPDAAQALPRSNEWAMLDVSGLNDSRWYGARIQLVLPDATLLAARMGRDGEVWKTAGHSRTTQPERLGQIRDERLETIRKRALDYLTARGKWPQNATELKIPAFAFVDPVEPAARLDWARYDPQPPQALKLGHEPVEGNIAAYSEYVTKQGRRAITRSGKLVWLRH